MDNLPHTVKDMTRNVTTHLARCLDAGTANAYCKEWTLAISAIHAQHHDRKSLFSDALEMTRQLNRTFAIEQPVCKQINQLILKSFSSSHGDTTPAENRHIDRDPGHTLHVVEQFLLSAKKLYDDNMRVPDQFTFDLLYSLYDNALGLDEKSLLSLKNWCNSQSPRPDFDNMQSTSLPMVVDHVYRIAALRFGPLSADILLADAVAAAQPVAGENDPSIWNFL